MLRFMKNKILIPLLIITALAAFFSFRNTGKDNDSDRKKILIEETIKKALQQLHFSPKQIDDSFSNMVYKRFLDRMDFDKRMFTQKDIDILAKYQYKIDDELQNGNVEFYDKFAELFNKRIDDAEGYYKEILKKPFDYTLDEEYVASGDDVKWPAGQKEMKERWRKYLKYRSLAKYVDLKKGQDKRVEDKDTSLKVVKTDAELEVEAREETRKSMEYFFRRLRKFDDEKMFAVYMNTITNTEDPHTDYFPPEDKERFDEYMAGKFFGIGARLKDEEGRIKVESILPGTPCWKQGDLKAGDEILKVAQGKGEPVDIQGYDIEDAVKLIRGPKGTEVRLTVKKVTGAMQEIPIVRGEVQYEETFARSAIINTDGNGKVGYIYLPDFYADFRDANGRRCAEDVAIEVMKLKNAGVNGIILDLRNNGGGSLNDVVNMAGLFVDDGPMVQVKSSQSKPVTLEDRQSGTLYDGPLAIMVNHGSASASEIMAAALQDYKRAIIVGTTTFGKGTVQKIISLDEYNAYTGRSIASKIKGQAPDTIGSLKLTIQKFYRVNGGSTQLKGVTPDIIFPDSYELIEYGERKDKASLPWDEIEAADYKIVDHPVNARVLAEKSYERINNDETFNLIKENAKRIKEQENDRTYALNEKRFREEQEEANEFAEQMKKQEKETTKLTFNNPKEDLPKINMDSTTIKKNKDWLKALQKDIYIAETVNIINDMNHMNMNVDMGVGAK